MTTQFETFDQSRGGAFIETAFESRGQRGEALPAGCCCAQWANWVFPTSQSPGHFEFFQFCHTIRWGARIWEWTCSEDPERPNSLPPQPFILPEEKRATEVPDEATAEALCLGTPEGDRVRRYCNVSRIEVAVPPLPGGWPYSPTQGIVRWNAPCHCHSASGLDEDFEERCGHIEGYCCALVLNRWQLSPEGNTTWAQHCTVEAQQKYYDDPITEIVFTSTPADPDHPCPADPAGRGWCCVIMLDGTVFHANPTGDGSNVLESECTVEHQQEEFDQFPEGGFVVIAVQWLGQVSDDDCDPCGIPEGTCCLTQIPPRGVCMMGLTADECNGLPGSTFNQGIESCTNCYEPGPISGGPWLGPAGRCCTTFQFRQDPGGQWHDQWKCQEVDEVQCEQNRAAWEADTDRFQRVIGEPWTIQARCWPQLAGDSQAEHDLQCGSIQGWCCLPDSGSADGDWMLQTECEESGGTFYDPEVNPRRLCDEARPCCLADEDGVVGCRELPFNECTRLGGITRGSPGTRCDDVDDDGNLVRQCWAGACCLGCSRCADNMPEVECERLGGQYRGHGTQCHEIADCPEGAI